MSIIYDVFSKGVMISFRGKEHTLPGPFPNQRAAIIAAEQYCVTHGWIDPGTQNNPRLDSN